MLIRPYNKSWPEDFRQIKDTIKKALKGAPADIHHVGSTAVPRLAAKPIIDIDIAYGSDTSFDTIKKGLETLGYYHNGNQGIPEREVFKRHISGNPHPVLDGIAHHLYVCPDTSAELHRHLAFRDYLRTHDDARAQYEDLKYQIAEAAGQDKKTYAARKEVQASSFIESILKATDSK